MMARNNLPSPTETCLPGRLKMTWLSLSCDDPFKSGNHVLAGVSAPLLCFFVQRGRRIGKVVQTVWEQKKKFFFR